jgi:hypothetical protein
MSGFELVAGVIGIFFTVGIVVGVLIVIALPPIRHYLRVRRNRYMKGGGWQEPPALDDDSDPPRWPGRRG